MSFLKHRLRIIAVMWFLGGATVVQAVVLVDFGATPAQNNFALNEWDQLLLSPNMGYTSSGPGGVIAVSDIDEYTDFRGVRGVIRNFIPGERIVVTWFNTFDQPVTMAARISFTDPDYPDGGEREGHWYTMRNFSDYRQTYTTVQPAAWVRTVFNITDGGVHKTNTGFDLININLHIEWFETYPKQYIVCDKIELFSDADVTPPDPPSALSAIPVSDSKIALSWQKPDDDTGVIEYLIYMDGQVEGYSREENFTAVYLQPDCTFTFTVTALDHCGNESLPSLAVVANSLPYQQRVDLITPESFMYLGAFRLPEVFSWGGESMAYFPNGDGGPNGSGAADGFSGSLFVTDLNQPQRGFAGQVSIPQPVVTSAGNIDDLPQAQTIANPVNIRPGNIDSWGDYVDIWRTGLEYFDDEDRLYSSWSVHYTVTAEKHACISCCDAENPAIAIKYGAWHVGDPGSPPLDAALGDYLFKLPEIWAKQNTAGQRLVTGRCRDGGLGGLGPGLYSFSGIGENPPTANSVLNYTTLLKYGPVEGTDGYFLPNAIDGYLLSDDWKDAAWLSAENQNAVVILGNKARGQHWYGYIGEHMRHDWIIADVPYPEFYITDPDGKGWKAHNFIPMAILYDPDDLARVSGGEIPSFQPQPYSAIRFDPKIFLGKKIEIRSMTFDPQSRLLFVLEFDYNRDGLNIVHVFNVNKKVLAVDFVTFTASRISKNILLNWVTANESNNYGFYIERNCSKNINTSAWSTIGFVKGYGYSIKPIEYHFIDYNVPDIRTTPVYRLKQTDRDGSFKYSDFVTYAQAVPIDFCLKQNFPNPFNSNTRIEFSIDCNTFVRLELYNVNGKKIKSLLKRKMNAGRHTVHLSMQDEASGVYFCRLLTEKYQATKKMIFVK
ncbi:T9SS type A sorting domain-containing protein [candidate division KSB1 bacterium]|nr:T9SS type A sorting domain-containing protein [candidate division KSB1 bacterium]